MKRNPFINNKNEEEGSLPEKIHLRHALFSKEGELPDIDKEWEKLQRRIEASEEKDEESDDSEQRGKRTLFFRWIAAAAVIAVVLGAAWTVVYINKETNRLKNYEVFVAQVPTTEHIVVKSVSTGKTHRLNSTTFVAPQQLKTETVHELTDTFSIEVPPGQEIELILPDSTHVWLWANSKLQYPEKFTSTTRTVRLTGEAFFDVSTDSVCPFVVETPYFTTRVYGTEFVVRAFNQSSACVMLVEGSVSVDIPNRDATAQLSPGQAATFYDKETIKLNPVDTYPWVQWRDGFFYFDEESLFRILLEIGRWYNITIISQNENVLEKKVHFVMDRTEFCEPVVEALNNLIDDAEITLEDGQIFIR